MFYLLFLLMSVTIHPSSTTYSSSSNCVEEKQDSFYDYIVIGSGPGGTTIATRLALNNFKVLLIEAGSDYDDGINRTPAFWPLTESNPEVTVHFNPYLYSQKDNITIQYPRAITLGGCTQNNALVAITANPSDWDYIEQVTNDPSWNSENIKNKYQKLVENCEYCTDTGSGKDKEGWLNISIPFHQNPSSQLDKTNPVLNDLLKTVSSQFKYNQNVDNNNNYDSWFYTPESVSQDIGIRSGAYRRLKSVQSIRPSNLHIWTNSFVTKLIIDPKTKETCGVKYINGSHLYKASLLASPSLNSNNLNASSIYAKREIIVSGGQWMTPQLLQLSGIGDRELLNQFGIETIQHLPGVGKNQEDRDEVPYIVKLKTNANLHGINSSVCTFNTTANDPCLIDYINNPTTSFYSSNLLLFSILRSTKPEVENVPDSVLSFVPLRFTGFRENWVQTAFQYPFGTYLSVNINVARVRSQLGTVHIQSTNSFDTPLIELNHFTGKGKRIDIDRAIQNIRFIRQLLNNSPFSKYIDYEDLPGSHLQTDQQLSDYIEQYVWGHHACCTAQMGNTEDDPLAVINSKAQVKGVKNLRICDISMFPKLPGYFPVVPIVTACEKIADDIITDARH